MNSLPNDNASSVLHLELSLPLNSFSLKVALSTHAQVTGVFGPSGCGKTSFLETLAGLRRNGKGQIRFGDTVWQDSQRGIFVSPEHRGIGYVPQDGLLFPHQTAEKNLLAGVRSPSRETFNSVVELLELGNFLKRNVRLLSGGERQRVALGRAICSGPRLILLDEPLASLDLGLRRRILPFLRRIREEFAIPMILVSHDPIEVQALCDDLVVLSRGQVVARGLPRQVLMDPTVFPTGGGRGFENVIPCSTVHSDDHQTIVQLGAPPSPLRLSLANLSSGVHRSRFVGISSRDIIVATTQPRDISARNILPAIIEEIHPLGSSYLLKASLAKELPWIAVEIGFNACEALGIYVGQPVYLIVKSMTCTLYEEHEKPTTVLHYPQPLPATMLSAAAENLSTL